LSIVDYGVTSSFPVFSRDGECAIGIATASFAISSPLVVDARGVLTPGGLGSRHRVGDDADLVMNRSRRGYGGDVVDTFLVGGVLGFTYKR
jgi:hypothetical protein